MKRLSIRSFPGFPLLLLCFAMGLSAIASVAAPIPYSGKVAINGANFQGDAQFTFALRDADGTVHWRNGVDANASINVPVDRGIYVVLLGGQGMNALSSNLFLDHPELYLQVRFYRADTQEWLHLAPDQRITSAPHALAAEVARNALTADAVKPGAITKNMLAADVLADLNATVVLPEQNATIQTGSITRSMLAPGVLSDLNATIAPGSITAGQLAPALLADLNRSVVITRSMLPSSVLADLNESIKTITRDMLPGDVLADLNRTILRDMLPASVLVDLNRTITRDMLPGDVLADLNHTIGTDSVTLAMLAPQVRSDLNGTIIRSRLAADILADLNRTFTISPGTVTETMLAAGTVTPGKLSPDLVAALKPVILQQPQSVLAVGGVSATFTTQATGGNLSYQWLQQGYAIAGANGNVLTVNDLNATLHDGNYTVTVTNAFGSATSAVATLDINGSVTQGLVGWWKFDETNGTIAVDSSVNGNNGTLHNGPTWVDGKIGGALSFDGANDFVSLPDIRSHFNQAASVAMWVKVVTQGHAGNKGGLVHFGTGSNLHYPHGDGLIHMNVLRDDSRVDNISPTTNFASWHLFTATTETSGNWRMYQNSALTKETTATQVGIPAQAFLGKSIGLDGTWFLHGLIDDVRIYDRALSAAEVQGLYSLGSGATTTTTGGEATIVSGQVAAGSVTTAQLSEQILKYLRPEVTSSPQAPGLVFGGQSVTLASQAEGKYLTYQWNRNGQPIAGATGSTLVIADVNGTLHDGNYTLVVSNDFGSVTSSPTGLQVDATPTNHSVASIGMQMIFCPPGTFTMGSPSSETGREVDETQHQVTLTNGFYLGKYELTQAQYETVMNGNSEGLNAKPSNWPNNDDRPVEKVSWEDAQVFLSSLNSIEQTAGRLPAGWKYVLPTEAEWEYACRAGTTTAYSWGNDVNSSHANWNYGNDANQTVNFGQYAANSWGFFDMSGNVAEWVFDWKANYPGGVQTNPEGPASGSNRLVRGGSWAGGDIGLRSARRNAGPPDGRHKTFGFRVGFKAISPDEADPELELFGGAGITREAGQPWAEPGVEAHDARDGNLTSAVTVSGTVDVNSTGTYVLTYSVSDAAGNEANATRTVTVSDTTDPVVTLLGDANATHAKDVAWVDPGATASDTLDGNLTNQVTITGTVDVNSSGAYVLTYSVSDAVGNDSNVTRVVNVGMATTHVVDLNATVAMQMLWVEPGTFTMGSPTTEAGRSTNEAEHNVTLTKGFYLGKYEVTQAQYEAVMTGNSNQLSATPSQYSGNDRPVEKVSWADAQVFLTRLNAAEQAASRLPSGWSYVLPTESEWEYACRAGTTTAYSWGNDINSSNANYNQSGIGQTRDVGQYTANPWGFHDMHGNVYEWTADWYLAAYPTGSVTDSVGPATGSYRVARGGSWYITASDARSAVRLWRVPAIGNNALGFRLGFKAVPDTTPPVLTLLGDANVTHAKDVSWVDPGATASDTLDGNLTNQVTISGTVDINSTGAYVLTYSVSDGAGNDSNVTRVVNVGMATTHTVQGASNLQMLWVESGTFTMGSPTTEAGRSTHEAEHNVTLTKGFYLGKYEVTQAQYEAVMTGNTNSLSATPSNWPNNPNRPVDKVSWDDAQIFLTRLNAAEQAAGRLPAGWSYVLPTESEWEYACRAGTTTVYSWGNDINSTQANYDQSGISQTRDVGQYAANPWGFFDMHGNVLEWTADWHLAAYPTGSVIDSTGPESGSIRVVRGGAWTSDSARSAYRHGYVPAFSNIHLGFRLGFKAVPDTKGVSDERMTAEATVQG